jgi:septal ring factor EnvC (AmiA/AmiB activator)
MILFFDNTFHLSIAGLIFFVTGGLIVGFAIHFLWVNRKGGEEAVKLLLKQKEQESDQWRLKYYDLEEAKVKELAVLSDTIKSLEEKEETQAIEIEELTLLNQQLMLKLKNNSVNHQSQNREQTEKETELIDNDTKNLRQELKKLAQQYNVLENEINRLQNRT